MAKPPLPEPVEALLLRPNPSVITTVRPDGQPVSVATWYIWERGRVLVNMDEARKRLEYVRQEPRVTLTVMSSDDWYTHVSLQGRVAELVDFLEWGNIDIEGWRDGGLGLGYGAFSAQCKIIKVPRVTGERAYGLSLDS